METSDDAGVYLLDGDQVLIQTVDFFTPIVDDPVRLRPDRGGELALGRLRDGRHADHGAEHRRLPDEGRAGGVALRDPAGRSRKGAGGGRRLLGGHTVEDPEIKYGLSVTGIGSRHQITANRGARVGDRLVLTKALGTGLVTSAIKRGVAERRPRAAVTESMRTLNRAASKAMVAVGVHALHGRHRLRAAGPPVRDALRQRGGGASGCGGRSRFFPTAEECARQGITTGGARNNETYLTPSLRFDRVA